VTDKLEKKKLEKEKIDEFLNETQKDTSVNYLDKSIGKSRQNKNVNIPRPYKCPRCHRLIKSRKEPCEFCDYNGYIPMSEFETKRVRSILFVVLMIVAIVVIILSQ
jgi:uncharacterized protein YlaI